MVNMDIYVDDIVFDTMAPHRCDVMEDIVAAVSDFVVSVQKCDLQIEQSKSAILSNATGVAQSISKALGYPAKQAARSVRSLGADFAAGRRVAKRGLATRHVRLGKLKMRRHRINKLARVNRKVGGQVFVCGIMPSLLYDATILGWFGNHLTNARRNATRFTGIGASGRSLDAVLSFNPKWDPEVLANQKLVHRFAREVWDASFTFGSSPAIKLSELAVGLNKYVCSNASPPKHPVGPVSATHKALHAASWRFDGPFKLVAKSGLSYHLLSVSPARIVKAYVSDLCDNIQMRVVTRLCKDNNSDEAEMLREKGPFFLPLIRLYNKLPPKQSKILLKIVSGSYYAGFDFFQMGFLAPFECSRCSSALDTAFHRCFTCPVIETDARIKLGARLFDKVVAAGEKSPFATRLLTPTPSMKSKPMSELYLEYFGFDEGVDAFSPADGPLFVDGSCLHPSEPMIARAGFCICQVDQGGRIIKRVLGCVPSPLPQTPLAGELAAIAVGAAFADQSVFMSDCSTVVAAHARGIAAAAACSKLHACTFRGLLKLYPDIHSRIRTINKTKAHREESAIQDGEVDGLFNFHGNQQADIGAKLGASLHEADVSDVSEYAFAKKEITTLAKFMVETLSDDVFNHERYPKVPRGFKYPCAATARHVHNFIWRGDRYICTNCLFRCLRPSCLSESAWNCKGVSSFENILGNNLGHRLFGVQLGRGNILVICSRCFGFAESVPRKLRFKCSGIVSDFAVHARRRVMGGKHPRTRAPLPHFPIFLC